MHLPKDDPYNILGVDPGLSATASFDVFNDGTFSNATHGVVVELHEGTGKVEILRYFCVEDCGVVIHPQVVVRRDLTRRGWPAVVVLEAVDGLLLRGAAVFVVRDAVVIAVGVLFGAGLLGFAGCVAILAGIQIIHSLRELKALL